jgi:hypothetical protein
MANPSEQSTTVQNRELIRRFYQRMWNRFDKSLIPVLLTQDIQFRGSVRQTND